MRLLLRGVASLAGILVATWPIRALPWPAASAPELAVPRADTGTLVGKSAAKASIPPKAKRAPAPRAAVTPTQNIAVTVQVLPAPPAVNRYALDQSYPNPFSGSTRIGYSCPSLSWVKIEVFNAMGERVAVLVDAIHNAGQYEMQWNGSNDGGRQLASGVYMCRMRVGPWESTQKLVIAR